MLAGEPLLLVHAKSNPQALPGWVDVGQQSQPFGHGWDRLTSVGMVPGARMHAHFWAGGGRWSGRFPQFSCQHTWGISPAAGYVVILDQ